MGVYLKDMEMPTSCMTCLFQTPYMGGWCSLLNDNSNAYSRRRDCPLISVPPHGRLIDAGELLEHAWRDKLDSRELIARMIDNAPTIIPASD